MNDATEVIAVIVGLVALCLLFIGAISISGYVANKQAMECMSLNASRSAFEIITLCGKVKRS